MNFIRQRSEVWLSSFRSKLLIRLVSTVVTKLNDYTAVIYTIKLSQTQRMHVIHAVKTGNSKNSAPNAFDQSVKREQ